MYCTQCGTKLDNSVRFCTACGKPTNPEIPWTPDTIAAPRRLRRIAAGKKIAGVCNGYAEYFDMDVTLMRVIWVGLLLVPPHLGLIAYLASWAVIPRE
jgi:phage shock protein C